MSLASATLESAPAETLSLTQFFLDKVDREAVLIRKTLERVPEGRNEFRPHERSMELGYLASLVAGILGWIPLMVERDELNLDDPSNGSLRTRPVETRNELVAMLDAAVAAARRSLSSTTDAHLLKPWAFKMGGRTLQRAAARGDACRRGFQPPRPSPRPTHRVPPPRRLDGPLALRTVSRRRHLIPISGPHLAGCAPGCLQRCPRSLALGDGGKHNSGASEQRAAAAPQVPGASTILMRATRERLPHRR